MILHRRIALAYMTPCGTSWHDTTLFVSVWPFFTATWLSVAVCPFPPPYSEIGFKPDISTSVKGLSSINPRTGVWHPWDQPLSTNPWSLGVTVRVNSCTTCGVGVMRWRRDRVSKDRKPTQARHARRRGRTYPTRM